MNYELLSDPPVGPESCWTGGFCPQQDHMPGGKFFTEAADGVGGEIQATYTEGDVIDVEFVSHSL